MSDGGNGTSEEEPKKKRPFIREKIARPPMSRRQMVMRFMGIVLIAVICGAVAGISFAVVTPLATRYLASEETIEEIPVTIPKDEPESQVYEDEPSSEDESGESEGSVGQSEEESTSDITSDETEEESEPVEDIVQSAIENYQYTEEELTSMYASLRSVVSEADKGIVEIRSVKEETDWFNNPIETAGLYAGAVIASTEREVLILTTQEAVESVDSILVIFEDGTEAPGYIKGQDKLLAMAVIGVDMGDLDVGDPEEDIHTLTLGNSFGVRQGDLVIALGAPSGITHSSTYGFISYVMRNVQVADGVTRLLFADIRGDSTAGTFLINTSGEMIGWVTDSFEEQQAAGLTLVMAISEYKTILEKMTNGIAIPYLGILGQEVGSELIEEGMPAGVYVAECDPDGPAYGVGIQPGDVIIQIGERSISTMIDYQNQIESMSAGDQISVIVMRYSIDDYKELEYQVTVGTR